MAALTATQHPGPPLHLVNAARVLERILNTRDSEHVYTVDIEPRDRDDAEGES